MQKSEILTARTLEDLNNQMREWGNNGWKLHGEVVVTAWEDKKATLPDGQPGLQSEATGFTQTMVKTEGTCRQNGKKGKDE